MSNKEKEMSNKGTVILAAIIMISILLYGCSNHSMLSKKWGSSYELAKNGQIANPDASKNMEPVEGFDGKTAMKALDGYQQGCEKQKKETTYNLRLGNIDGIGKKKNK